MPSPTVLRESITGLSMLAARQLALMLPDLGRVPPSALPMQDVIPEVVDTYGSAAAVLGSDWYDATREEQGVKGASRPCLWIQALGPVPGTHSL